MLDFRKVEVAEREAAKAWVSKDPMELDRKIGVRGSSKRKMSEDGDGEGPDAVAAQTTRKQPSKERLMAIKAAIAGAATLDEVERLERSLMDEAGD